MTSWKRFGRHQHGNIIIMSAALLAIISTFTALIFETARASHTRALMEEAARLGTRAGSIAYLRFPDDELAMVRAAQRYYNANAGGNVQPIERSAITVNNMARQVEIHAVQKHTGLIAGVMADELAVQIQATY